MRHLTAQLNTQPTLAVVMSFVQAACMLARTIAASPSTSQSPAPRHDRVQALYRRCIALLQPFADGTAVSMASADDAARPSTTTSNRQGAGKPRPAPGGSAGGSGSAAAEPGVAEGAPSGPAVVPRWPSGVTPWRYFGVYLQSNLPELPTSLVAPPAAAAASRKDPVAEDVPRRSGMGGRRRYASRRHRKETPKNMQQCLASITLCGVQTQFVHYLRSSGDKPVATRVLTNLRASLDAMARTWEEKASVTRSDEAMYVCVCVQLCNCATVPACGAPLALTVTSVPRSASKS